jgi:hypothetical protein
MPATMGRFERRGSALFWLLAAAAAAVYLAMPAAPKLAPDSPGYMYFDAGRPVGYPLFLAALKGLTGSFALVRPVQIVLLAASTAAAAHAFYLLTKRWVLALVFELGALLYPAPFKFADKILTDSYSSALNLFFFAAVLWFAARPSLRRFALACLLIAISLPVRPVNIGLVPVAALAALAFLPGMGPKLRSFGLLAAAVVFGLGLTPAVNLHLHGSAATYTPLSRGLLSKTVFIPRTLAPDAPPEQRFLAETITPVADYFQTIPANCSDLARPFLANYMRFNVIIPTLVNRNGLSRGELADPIFRTYVGGVIADHKAEFAAASAHDYALLASNSTFIDRARYEACSAWFGQHPPPLPAAVAEQDDYSLVMVPRAATETGEGGIENEQGANVQALGLPKPRPWLFILGIDAIQIAAVALSLAAALFSPALAFRRFDIRIVMLCLAGVLIQFNLLATAIGEIAQPRYVYPIWPFLWLTFVLGADLAIGRIGLKAKS